MIVLLIGFGLTGCLVVGHRYRQTRVARIRNRARLRVINGQLATFRAALRIAMAEHAVRQAMRRERTDQWP